MLYTAPPLPKYSLASLPILVIAKWRIALLDLWRQTQLSIFFTPMHPHSTSQWPCLTGYIAMSWALVADLRVGYVT